MSAFQASLVSSWQSSKDMSDCVMASYTFSPLDCQHFTELKYRKVQQIQNRHFIQNTVIHSSSGTGVSTAECFHQLQDTTSANNMMHPPHPAVKALLPARWKHPQHTEIMLFTETVAVCLQDNCSYYCCWNELVRGTGGPAVRRQLHNLYLPQSSPSSCVWSLNWVGKEDSPADIAQVLKFASCSINKVSSETHQGGGWEGSDWGGRRYGSWPICTLKPLFLTVSAASPKTVTVWVN